MSTRKERVRMVALLMLIASISATMLQAIYSHTAPLVARHREIQLKRSVLDVFGIAYTEATMLENFDAAIVTEDRNGLILYKYCDPQGKDPAGIAFRIYGSGFWGPITALVAFAPETERIIGLKILDQVETPGLGGRIVEPWFQEQFKGKQTTSEIILVSQAHVQKENEVDAITGATKTCRAFERMLNEGIGSIRKELGIKKKP